MYKLKISLELNADEIFNTDPTPSDSELENRLVDLKTNLISSMLANVDKKLAGLNPSEINQIKIEQNNTDNISHVTEEEISLEELKDKFAAVKSKLILK